MNFLKDTYLLKLLHLISNLFGVTTFCKVNQSTKHNRIKHSTYYIICLICLFTFNLTYADNGRKNIGYTYHSSIDSFTATLQIYSDYITALFYWISVICNQHLYCQFIFWQMNFDKYFTKYMASSPQEEFNILKYLLTCGFIYLSIIILSEATFLDELNFQITYFASYMIPVTMEVIFEVHFIYISIGLYRRYNKLNKSIPFLLTNNDFITFCYLNELLSKLGKSFVQLFGPFILIKLSASFILLILLVFYTTSESMKLSNINDFSIQVLSDTINAIVVLLQLILLIFFGTMVKNEVIFFLLYIIHIRLIFYFSPSSE